MRELVVQICFDRPSLGNIKTKWSGDSKLTYFAFARDSAGAVMFLPTWWRANLTFAAKLLCRHEDLIEHIFFDPSVIGCPGSVPDQLYKRWYGQDRLARHEAFPTGSTVGINVAIPSMLSDDDLQALFDIAGRYCGVSAFGPREYGHFRVTNVKPRRRACAINSSQEVTSSDR